MDHTVGDVAVLGWRMLATVATSSVLTTLGVYLLARFTKVFDFYAAERGKILAQHHDLDKLVRQTAELTSTAERIKSQLADQAWDRQARWTYKRTVYVQLIQSIGRWRVGLAKYQAGLVGLQAGESWGNEEKEAGFKMAHGAQLRFSKAYEIAPIAISKAACGVADQVLKVKYGPITSPEDVQGPINELKRLAAELRREASADLGFETH